MDWLSSRLASLLSYRVLRFALVGVTNTLVNFIILNAVFHVFGVNKIAANLIATSCALVYSFLLNRSYVFAHKGRWQSQFLRFFAVTAVGTLLLNNAVFALGLHLFAGLSVTVAHAAQLSADTVQINCSALLATMFGMVWNYLGYKILVFRDMVTSNE